MPPPAEIQRNLIQRVNVGDSLTRTAARRPHALARGRRRTPTHLRPVQRPGQSVRQRARRAWLPARRRAGPGQRVTASNSWSPTTHAPSSGWCACRSTSAGAATRSPTSSATATPVASSPKLSCWRAWLAALATQAEAVTDLIIAPGADPDAEPGTQPVARSGCRFAELTEGSDDSEPEYLVGGPRPDQLPLHQRDHVVPERGRRQPHRRLPRITVDGAGGPLRRD